MAHAEGAVEGVAGEGEEEEEEPRKKVFRAKGLGGAEYGNIIAVASYVPSQQDNTPRLVTAYGKSPSLEVWATSSGKLLRNLRGFTGPASSLCTFYLSSSSRPCIASGHVGGTVVIWDGESYAALQVMGVHQALVRVHCLYHYLEPGAGRVRLVAGLNDGRLRVHDVESGETLQTLECFESEVSELAGFLSPVRQAHSLVAGCEGGQVRVLDPERGEYLLNMTFHTKRILSLVCFESSAPPYHTHVASTSDDGSTRVWSGETGMLIYNLEPASDVPAGPILAYREVEGEWSCIAAALANGQIKVGDTLATSPRITVSVRILKAIVR
jgi:WD40 repeat protein